MTARIPTDPVEREALAGEYVLGTLDARMAAAVVAALGTDTSLRRSVEAWEDRLTPLASLAVQEAPPPELWDRIVAGLPQIAGRAVVKPSQAKDFWRIWAIGASLAAAVLAGFAMLQATRPTVMEATAVPAQVAPAAIPPVPPSALATVPDPTPTPIAPAPSKLATQPVPDTGVRKANGEANGAVRPAAGAAAGTVRPSTNPEPGGILR